MDHFRTTRDGSTWYLTKWKDLGYDEATWETDESDIVDFLAEIEKYLANRCVERVNNINFYNYIVVILI